MTHDTLARAVPGETRWFPALRRLLMRERYQLAGGLLFAAVLPLLLWIGTGKLSAAGGYADTTLMVGFAVVLSQFFVQALARYPAPSSLSISLPAVSAAFAVVIVGITITHAEYSRGLLLSGFVISVAWYALLGTAKRQYMQPRLVLVPAGAGVNQFCGSSWRVLSSPSPEVVKHAQGIVADLEADLSPEWRQFLTSCAVAGIPVYDSTRMREMITGEVELNRISDIGFEALLPHRSYLILKSAIDFSIAALMLPLALPVIGLAAVAVRLESRGPALFVQERVGYQGRVFRCYKLRSMRSSEAGAGLPFTTDHDPRITRVGAFIRKYRIDELPQIFNILKGEMSWIGPRPESVPLSQNYEASVPFYRFRHAVKPGISGWAAIQQGNVGGVDAATIKLRYDFFYIKNSSFSLDLYIAYRTAVILLTGFGSK
ncbi:MAG TPA: polyprenyl glycosylphosphotransferase [Verrucomicrobiales bacterium]|nr:polyprenyl glycosylphosphotransferase [Verrucomicrobiales bacterium]